MVGLFAYNPPQILEALTSADNCGNHGLASMKMLKPATIVDGTCYGTVVQNPCLRLSISESAGGARYRSEGHFELDDFIDIPARKILKANVQEFWDELKKLTGEDDADEGSDSAE